MATAILAQLELQLHGHFARITIFHVSFLKNLLCIVLLTENKTTAQLLHFNAHIVMQQAQITHLEHVSHFFLEIMNVWPAGASDY
jgi:hypothetical protein